MLLQSSLGADRIGWPGISCLEILAELYCCQSTLRADKLGQFYAASRPQKLTFITWPTLWALSWSQSTACARTSSGHKLLNFNKFLCNGNLLSCPARLRWAVLSCLVASQIFLIACFMANSAYFASGQYVTNWPGRQLRQVSRFAANNHVIKSELQCQLPLCLIVKLFP